MLGKKNIIKLDGNNNVIYQDVTISFEHFVERFSKEKDERIKELKKAIADKEKLIKKSERLYDLELNDMKDELEQVKKERQKLENELKETIKRLEETDFSKTNELYRNASSAFMEGRIDKALTLLDDAELEKQEIKLAENRILKARLLEIKGKYKEAGLQYKKAVTTAKTYDSLFNYADFLHKQNKLKKAIDFYIKALKILKDNNNSYLPQKASTLYSLAFAYKTLNKHTYSETYFLEALDIYKTIDSNSPKLKSKHAKVLTNLGTLYTKLNRLEKAEDYLQKSLKLTESLSNSELKETKLAIADTKTQLGHLYTKKMKYHKAEIMLHDAFNLLNIFADANPAEFLPVITSLLNDLGNLHFQARSWEKAKKLLTQALEMNEILVKINPNKYLSNLRDARNNLGILYKEMSILEKSETLLLKSLSIATKLADKIPEVHNPVLAKILNNLGNLYRTQNKYKEAEKKLIPALSIYQKLAEEKPEAYAPELAELLHDIGVMYYKTNQYKKADDYYNKSIAITENLTANDFFNTSLAITLQNKGWLYHSWKKESNAETYLLRAQKKLENLAQNNEPIPLYNLSSCLNHLAVFYTEISKPAQADIYYQKILTIRSSLAEHDSENYTLEYCCTLIQYAQFNAGFMNKELIITTLLEEAILILKKMPETPKVKEPLKFALEFKANFQ